MTRRPYDHRYDEEVVVPARPEAVFAFLDDPIALAGHMSRRSWRMGGGTMTTTTDHEGGQEVGSRIEMQGRVLGMQLGLAEVVTLRDPPFRKEWATVGTPRLLVVGGYRMAFEVQPAGDGSRVRVSIEYGLPAQRAWLGRAFGATYARWCVRQMIREVRAWFAAGNARPAARAGLPS